MKDWNNNFFFTCSDLGHISSGMSCDFLRLFSNNTDFVELLRFVSEQPGGTRPALVRNKCMLFCQFNQFHKIKFHSNKFRCVLFVVPAKMYHRRIEATACNEPQCFEPWVCSNATVSVSLISGKYLNCLSEVIHIHTFALLFSSMTMIEELSNASFRAILDHIQTHFADFLRMPHYKQTNLAEKAVTELVKHQHEPYKYCP